MFLQIFLNLPELVLSRSNSPYKEGIAFGIVTVVQRSLRLLARSHARTQALKNRVAVLVRVCWSPALGSRAPAGGEGAV